MNQKIEVPILFKSTMVRSLLVGQKTQTRRVNISKNLKPGTELWVKEPWEFDFMRDHIDILYRSSCSGREVKYSSLTWKKVENLQVMKTEGKKSSLFLPKALSRIRLCVTNTHLERLQSISDEDIWKEGFDNRDTFSMYWDHLHWGRSWEQWKSNPLIHVVKFEMKKLIR